MVNVKSVTLRCDDRAENLVFNRYSYGDTGCCPDYEINIEDSYCGGGLTGIKGRFKRAWHAFFAKPVYYSGICKAKPEDIKVWLEDCLDIINHDMKGE